MSYFNLFETLKEYKTPIIIFFTIIIIYIVHRYLRLKAKEYYSQDYWEKRYGFFNKTMDWYTNFEEINNKFKIIEIISNNFDKRSKCNILELGCGDSTMAYDIYKKGFTKITPIDWSKNVIEKMKTKYKDTNINFKCADFNNLDEDFPKEHFEVIIEKAGLDSIATKQSKEVPDTLFNVYKKMHYVLKEGGIVLSISSKNPTFWKTTVLNKLVDEKLFDIVQIKRSTFSTVSNPDIMNMYFYYLKKK